MTHLSLGKLVLVLIAVWLATVIVLSGRGVFDSAAPGPLPLGLAVISPVLVFAAWYASSARFRELVLTLDPKILTLAQTVRLVGFVFLALAARGILPHTFANIAGWGDIFIGVTAPFVAYRLVVPHRVGPTIVWQALGMADLITAITLGVLSSPTPIGFLAEGPITTRAMGLLPMSLVPTFFVPLLFIFHIILIAQARRWPQAQYRERLAAA
jgi:hypothetical protein